MKNKILTFIIGVLVGAILATTGFLIYSKTVKRITIDMINRKEQNGQMQRPEWNMENLPEKPQGDFQPPMNKGTEF